MLKEKAAMKKLQQEKEALEIQVYCLQQQVEKRTETVSTPKSQREIDMTIFEDKNDDLRL